jgi:hypothetical protein
MVAEGTLEADVKDDVIVDIRVRRRPKRKGSFFESAVERRQEFGRFIKDTDMLASRMPWKIPIA